MHSMLEDPGFHVSTMSKEARHTTLQLLESLDSCITAHTVIEEIISYLADCVSNHQQMWSLFHKGHLLRSLVSGIGYFVKLWECSRYHQYSTNAPLMCFLKSK